MPDRLVDLQRHLLAAEDQVGRVERRAASARSAAPAPPRRSGPRCPAGRARGPAPSRGCRTGRGCRGSDRRWVSPSPTAVALIAAPHSRMCWSIRVPSLETNHLRGVPDPVGCASARSAPAPASSAVTPSRRSPFSASADGDGSSRHSLAQWPVDRRRRHEAAVRAGDEASTRGRRPPPARRPAGAAASSRRPGRRRSPSRADQGADADAGALLAGRAPR